MKSFPGTIDAEGDAASRGAGHRMRIVSARVDAAMSIAHPESPPTVPSSKADAVTIDQEITTECISR